MRPWFLVSNETEAELAARYGLCPRCGSPRRPFLKRWLDDDARERAERGLTCECETDGGPR